MLLQPPQRNTRDFETTVSDCSRLETGDGWLTVVRARAEQTADEQEPLGIFGEHRRNGDGCDGRTE
jgi:hypothetical protein